MKSKELGKKESRYLKDRVSRQGDESQQVKKQNNLGLMLRIGIPADAGEQLNTSVAAPQRNFTGNFRNIFSP